MTVDTTLQMTSDSPRRWCIDEAHMSKLVSPSAFTFNAEWSPSTDDISIWKRFPLPTPSTESHLDFDSDDSGDEDDAATLDPFMANERDDSLWSDPMDRDSDEMSFVLRESARALIEDIQLNDPVMHYDSYWRSYVDASLLETLDDQLKSDPRGSWTAMCWSEAAPEEALSTEHAKCEEEETLRPHTAALIISAFPPVPRSRSRARSPVTPGDPILAGTPPLSPTPKSPTPRSPPAVVDIDDPLALHIAAPVPRYRPISDPPPYSVSESPSTWTSSSLSIDSLAGKSSSPFTSSEASEADNEASTDDDDSADTRTFTEGSSDFESVSDQRSSSASDPSLSTPDSRSQAAPIPREAESAASSAYPSLSPSPAPSSLFVLPHAYSSTFLSAYTQYNSSPSVCKTNVSSSSSAAATPVPPPREHLVLPKISCDSSPTSVGNTPPPSFVSSPVDGLPLPFPLFSVTKPSEAIHFSPERNVNVSSPPRSQKGAGGGPQFLFRSRTAQGTWKSPLSMKDRSRSPSEDSALHRLASRWGTLSRKLTNVTVNGHHHSFTQ